MVLPKFPKKEDLECRANLVENYFFLSAKSVIYFPELFRWYNENFIQKIALFLSILARVFGAEGRINIFIEIFL